MQDKHLNMSDDDKRYLSKYEKNLSDTTTKYGKWINSTGIHEDHKGQSLVTRTPEVIRKWAEERNAVPATVEGKTTGSRPGVLRFNFPGFSGSNLVEISWDEWLKIFSDRELVFIFQEHTKDGEQSNFFQLDNPHREHD